LKKLTSSPSRPDSFSLKIILHSLSFTFPQVAELVPQQVAELVPQQVAELVPQQVAELVPQQPVELVP
jgi:hypothetical protein